MSIIQTSALRGTDKQITKCTYVIQDLTKKWARENPELLSKIKAKLSQQFETSWWLGIRFKSLQEIAGEVLLDRPLVATIAESRLKTDVFSKVEPVVDTVPPPESPTPKHLFTENDYCFVFDCSDRQDKRPYCSDTKCSGRKLSAPSNDYEDF
jgi:hypothetical protein